MSIRQILLCGALAFLGCNQSQPQTTSIAACAKGWVYDSVAGDQSCTVACQAKTPECGASDCVQRSYVGFLSGGVEIEALVSYSASKGTMSTLTAASKRSYAITTDTTYVLTPPGGDPGTVTAKCQSGSLIETGVGGKPTAGSFAPAPSSFSQALDAQINAGNLSWSGVMVGH